MKNLRNKLLAGTVIFSFFLAVAWIGSLPEKLTLMFSFTIPACCVLAYLWRKTKKKVFIVGLWMVSAIVFGYLGWFIHPDQTYNRAVNRLYQWKVVGDRYALTQEVGVFGYRNPTYVDPGGEYYEPPDPPQEAKIKWKIIREELAARKLEYRAAKIRYNGEPKYFRSTFYTWVLWSFAIVLMLNGISEFLCKR